MNDKEWGTPVSRDKIIYRRNKLIEYQRIGELRFTPLYEIIDENILDINYMIYEIEQLQSNWNSLREYIEENKKVVMEYTKRIETSELCQGDYPVPYYHAIKRIDLDNLYLDKMNELESGEKN